MKTTRSRLLLIPIFVAIAFLVVASASAAAPIRIEPLGDSITAGYTDNPTWSVPFGFGYRSGLYTRLTNANYPFQYVGASQEPWNGVFGVPKTVSAPDLRTVNQDFHRGYGGVDASYLNTNISSWLNADTPDVILLMIGINDIGQGASGNPTAAEASLNTLVQNIVNLDPKAHLVVAQITPYATYTDSTVQYNNYIKNTLVPHYSALGKNVSTVDQYSNFGSGTSVNSSLYSNGINHPNASGYDLMAQTWYNGIQALGPIVHSVGPAATILANGGFEATQYANNTHTINPGDSAWTFTTGSSGAGSGVDHGNPYGAAYTSNCTPSTGKQMSFLQGAGAGYGTSGISQNMSGLIVGRTYNLSFSAKGINGFSGTDPFSVSVNNSTLNIGGSTSLSPVATSTYTTYSTSFVATSLSMPLRFADAGNVAVTKVTWIDDVKLGLATPAGSNLVTNGTFEATSYANNTHNVNPSGTGWRFTAAGTSSGSGIDRGNPYGSTNATAYEGSQYAFLQGRGEGSGTTSIEQDVAGFQVGKTYILSFESAGIQGFSGADPFFASLGGNSVTFGGSDWISPSGSYGLYCSDAFVATSSTMTLQFHDAGNVPATFASFIDDVQITAVPEPSTVVFLLILASVSCIAALRRRP
jgi:lysophospholipase L1-like esterase